MTYTAESKKKTLREALTTHAEFHLSSDQWQQFCEALDQPARSIPRLALLLTQPTIPDAS